MIVPFIVSTTGDKFSSNVWNLIDNVVDLFFGKSVNLAVSLAGEATNLVVVNGLILFNSMSS